MYSFLPDGPKFFLGVHQTQSWRHRSESVSHAVSKLCGPELLTKRLGISIKDQADIPLKKCHRDKRWLTSQLGLALSPAPSWRGPGPDASFRNRGKALTADCCSCCGGRSLCRFLGAMHGIHRAVTWPICVNETLCCLGFWEEGGGRACSHLVASGSTRLPFTLTGDISKQTGGFQLAVGCARLCPRVAHSLSHQETSAWRRGPGQGGHAGLHPTSLSGKAQDLALTSWRGAGIWCELPVGSQ